MKFKAGRPVLIGAGGFLGQYLADFFKDSALINRRQVTLDEPGAGQRLAECWGTGDTVLFLASLAPDKGRDAETFLKNCRMGVELVKALERQKPARLVYFSSDAVFRENIPLLGETSPPCPSSLYGTMHLARETMLAEACVSLGIPILVIRLCAVYGPGDTHNAYGPNRFLHSALATGVIELFGFGEERRPHIWIMDVVRAVKGLLDGNAQGVIHLIPPSSVTFAEIAGQIKQLISGVEIRNLPRVSPVSHKDFSASSISRWIPGFEFTDLEAGLRLSLAKMR